MRWQWWKEPSAVADWLDVFGKVLFFLLPFQLGRFFWPQFSFVWGIKIDFLAPVIYVTDLVVLAVFGLLLLSGRLKLSWRWGMLAVFAAGNIYFALRPGLAAWRFLKLAELLVVIYFVRRFFARSWWPFLLAGVVIANCLALGQFFRQSSWDGLAWWLGERHFDAGTLGLARIQLGDRWLIRPMGTFSHPNSLAGFILIASLLVVCFASGWRKRPIIRVWLLLNGLVLLLSFSLAVYLALILLGAWFGQKKCGWPWPVVGLIVGGLVGGLIYSGLLEEVSVTGRVKLLKQAGLVIRRYPVWGAGLGNFIPAAAQLTSARFSFLAQPVHNIYLLWLAETGLVGVVLAVYWLRRMRGRITGLVFLPLAAILFLGLFDHYWLTLQQNWLLLGVTLGLWQKVSGRDPSLR